MKAHTDSEPIKVRAVNLTVQKNEIRDDGSTTSLGEIDVIDDQGKRARFFVSVRLDGHKNPCIVVIAQDPRRVEGFHVHERKVKISGPCYPIHKPGE